MFSSSSMMPAGSASASISTGAACQASGGGIAYILADELKSDDLEFLDIGTVEIQDEVTWAAQAGLHINFSERFAIGVDAKYIAYTPESATAGDDEPVDLDLNPIIFSAGVKFRW